MKHAEFLKQSEADRVQETLDQDRANMKERRRLADRARKRAKRAELLATTPSRSE